MTTRILIQYGERNKVAFVQNDNLLQVNEVAKRLYVDLQTREFVLEVYDKGFNMYVEVFPEYDVKPQDVFKVKILSESCDPSIVVPSIKGGTKGSHALHAENCSKDDADVVPSNKGGTAHCGVHLPAAKLLKMATVVGASRNVLQKLANEERADNRMESRQKRSVLDEIYTLPEALHAGNYSKDDAGVVPSNNTGTEAPYSDESSDEDMMRDDMNDNNIEAEDDGQIIIIREDSKESSTVKTPKVPLIYTIDREAGDPIPDPFPFPKTYEITLEAELSIGNLHETSKAKLATTISGIMATYTRYPKPAEYSRVSREVMQKYPFLKDPISGDGYFKRMLQQRFTHYRRTKKSRGQPKVTIKRQNEKWGKGKGPMKKARMEEIEVPCGEDEASFNRHNNYLVKEYKKKKRTIKVVDQLMRASFAQRRNYIVQEAPSVVAILNKFVFLDTELELLKEFARILDEEVVFGIALDKTWKEKERALSSVLKQNFSKVLSKELEPLGKLEELEDYSEGQATLVILAAASLMLKGHKERPLLSRLVTIVPETCDIEDIANSIEKPTPSLVVLLKDGKVSEVYLVVEGVPFKNLELTYLPIYLLATFYVFNIHYPKDLTNFYHLLEYVCLGNKIRKPSTTLSKFVVSLSAYNKKD